MSTIFPSPEKFPLIPFEIMQVAPGDWLMRHAGGEWRGVPAEAGEDFASICDWIIAQNPRAEVAWV
jgi:hypothetical protein